MPLVKRIFQYHVEPTFGVVDHEATVYVPPAELRPGDQRVPLEEISNEQLQELAADHPQEYAAALRERGLAPTIDPQRFITMNHLEAAKLVRELDDEDRLIGYFLAEFHRQPQRPTVLEAFAERGLDQSFANEVQNAGDAGAGDEPGTGDEDSPVDTSDLDDDEE